MAITRQIERRALVLQPTNAEVSTNQVYAAKYEFLVDGELTLPVARVVSSLKHSDAAFTIYRVDVSVNKGGTSQYQVVIKSYDVTGGDMILHVDQYVSITGDRERISVPILNAEVPENRSLECSIYESIVGTPATDMTVTLIAEDFANLQPERLGHRVLNLNAVVQAQRGDLQFRDMEASDDALNDRTIIKYPDAVIMGSNDVDWSQGYIFYRAISANTTFTFSNIVEGRVVTLVILNTSGTNRTVTFPSGLYRDPAISLTVQANRANMYTFTRADGKTFVSYLTALTNV